MCFGLKIRIFVDIIDKIKLAGVVSLSFLLEVLDKSGFCGILLLTREIFFSVKESGLKLCNGNCSLLTFSQSWILFLSKYLTSTGSPFSFLNRLSICPLPSAEDILIKSNLLPFILVGVKRRTAVTILLCSSYKSPKTILAFSFFCESINTILE